MTTESSTGSTSSQRVHLTLTIHVQNLDFDPQASQLHVSGRITSETPHTKVGAHHTLDLELNRNFTIEKADGWDSVALEVVRDACDPEKRGGGSTIGAVIMHEGLANICVITEWRTVLKQRVELPVARKRAGGLGSAHEKGMRRFFQTVLETLLRNVDLTEPRPVLLASPGFVAANFQKFVFETIAGPPKEMGLEQRKMLAANKNNFVVAHSSSGHVYALAEVLASPAVTATLAKTRFAKETAAMDRFFDLLRADDGRAWYGPKEVENAVNQGAVGRGGGTLMISDFLFRSQLVGVRKRWVQIVDRVKKDGGDVRILSSEHESGKRLEGLGGIAAILTYPLLDLDEENPQVDAGDDPGAPELAAPP